MHVEEVYATWHFSIILISLRVEVAQILDYLLHAKILPLLKAFFSIIYTGQERHSSFTKKHSYKDIARNRKARKTFTKT